jgi:hypothetical protein
MVTLSVLELELLPPLLLPPQAASEVTAAAAITATPV